jgi:hypothetical protein
MATGCVNNDSDNIKPEQQLICQKKIYTGDLQLLLQLMELNFREK